MTHFPNNKQLIPDYNVCKLFLLLSNPIIHEKYTKWLDCCVINHSFVHLIRWPYKVEDKEQEITNNLINHENSLIFLFAMKLTSSDLFLIIDQRLLDIKAYYETDFLPPIFPLLCLHWCHHYRNILVGLSSWRCFSHKNLEIMIAHCTILSHWYPNKQLY